MLNEKTLKLFPDISNYGPDFQDFLRMCYGIRVKTTIVKRIDEKIGIEDLATLRTIELGEKDAGTHDISSDLQITASWIDNIDYESLDYYLRDYDIPTYYQVDSEVEDSQKDDASRLAELNNLRNMKLPYGFKGQVVTPDMAVTFSDNLLQVAITVEDKGLVVAYGSLDSDKKMNNIQVAFYDNMLALDENVDLMAGNPSYEPTINVNTIKQTVENLKAKGELPVHEETLNFNDFLASQDLNSYVNSPIAALYYSKDALVALAKPREKA